MSNDNTLTPEGYEDVIYKLTYRALSGFVPLIPKGIHPNQITWMAFTSSLIACALLYFIKTPAAFLWWALFNFIWYILDAFDGMHARCSGQTSEFGGFLDHFLDNIFLKQ